MKVGIPVVLNSKLLPKEWVKDLSDTFLYREIAEILAKAYINFVEVSGHDPVLVTQKNNRYDYDCLLLPGGEDVDPEYYKIKNSNSVFTFREKDDFERLHIQYAIKERKQILGICRGHQILFYEMRRMNPQLFKDFRFVQHLPFHEFKNKKRTNLSHLLLDIHNNGLFPVNSFHHQGIFTTSSIKKLKAMKDITINYVLPEKLEDNYLVEGITYNKRIRTVQFHPEEFGDTYSFLFKESQ